MSGLTTKILPAFILFSVFFLPDFPLHQKLPYFRVEDFLLPLVLWFSFRAGLPINISRNYLILLLSTALWIAITIMANLELNPLSSWFEIYKIVKYGTFFYFFFSYTDLRFIKRLVTIFFIPLLLFNLLHYFNVGGFNKSIMPLYGETIHLELFGLDSLGNPGTKRMLGTAGNPNDNSMMFLFFLAFLLPSGRKFSGTELTLFLLSFSAIILCQSRTGFLAAIFITILNMVLLRPQLTYALSQLLGAGLIFTLINKTNFETFSFSDGENTGSTRYLESLVDPSVTQSASYKGRLEIWGHMWDMSKDRLLFGHGPYKQYFYDNGLYPEGQYPLWLWRYGIPGVLLYASLYIYPLIRLLAGKLENLRHPGALFILAMLVTGITNTPFHNPIITPLFAVAAAMALRSKLPEA